MIELQYESKFDGFLVDLWIGPAEELNQAMFGGEPVFTYKRGVTVSADTMPAETFGCLVWVERLDGSPESIAAPDTKAGLRPTRKGTKNSRISPNS